MEEETKVTKMSPTVNLEEACSVKKVSQILFFTFWKIFRHPALILNIHVHEEGEGGDAPLDVGSAPLLTSTL